MKRAIAAAVLAGCLMGCYTTFHGSAPASEGKLYVIGSKWMQKVIYLCPDTPQEDKEGSRCEMVHVGFKN